MCRYTSIKLNLRTFHTALFFADEFAIKLRISISFEFVFSRALDSATIYTYIRRIAKILFCLMNTARIPKSGWKTMKAERIYTVHRAVCGRGGDCVCLSTRTCVYLCILYTFIWAKVTFFCCKVSTSCFSLSANLMKWHFICSLLSRVWLNKPWDNQHDARKHFIIWIRKRIHELLIHLKIPRWVRDSKAVNGSIKFRVINSVNKYRK